VTPAEEVGYPPGETPQDEVRDLGPLAVAPEMVDPHPEIAQAFAIGSAELLEDPPMAVVCDADVEVAAELLAEAEVVGVMNYGFGLVVDRPALGEQSRAGADVFADELSPPEVSDLLKGGFSVGGKGV